MSKLLHVWYCLLALVFINHIECIQLTKLNVISLGGKDYKFGGKNINEVDPLALGVIKSRNLSLEDNKLSYLQEELFNYNTNFEELRFESNKISEIHPLAFRKLQNLGRIDLDSNQLTEIDESLFERNTNLWAIFLHFNKITYFHPNTFKYLTKLEYLYVYSNQLTSFDFNLLSSSKEMKYLYLYNNYLTEIRYHFLKLRFPKLFAVSFSQNKFNCSFAKQIKDYLDKEHIDEYYDSISCISDAECAGIVKDRQLVSGRQLSVELENMQLKLEEKSNNITTELQNYIEKLENANEQIIIENAKLKGDTEKIKDDIEDMKNVTIGLKLQLLEQQAITVELKSVTDLCCHVSILP